MIIESLQSLTLTKASLHGDPRHHAISLLLANDPKLLDFLFNDERSGLALPAEELKELSGTLSGGEQILVRTALDLWDESGGVQICDIIYRLDRIRLHGFLLAIEALRFPSQGCATV
jgi:hypothetical protein